MQTWQLHLPADQTGHAFLSRDGCIAILLAPRFWRLLLVLLDARAEDVTLPRFAAGWRSREQIAKAMAALAGNPIPLDVDTVSAYAYRLLRKLAKAAPETSPCGNLRLIEQKRGVGYRIADGIVIEVVYGSERRTT